MNLPPCLARALLGVALGTVLLPVLSAAHARHDDKAYSELLDWGLRLVVLLGLPAAVGLALLSDGLVATLFNYGAFNAHDVTQTRLAVIAYAVGLLGLLSIKILAPAFYARQDIRTPVRIAMVVLVATQLFNVVFVPLYAHAGLALSIGLGASLNAGLLMIILRRRRIYQPRPHWIRFLMRVAPALLALAAILVAAGAAIDWLALAAHPLLRVGLLTAVLSAAMAVYFAMLFLCGFRRKDFTVRRA